MPGTIATVELTNSVAVPSVDMALKPPDTPFGSPLTWRAAGVEKPLA